MIRYLQNNEIDYKRWDDCIDRAWNGNIYAYSWYLDIVCEGWNALVAGDYEQVMPLTSGKKHGVAYLYQPPFTQQSGVFSTSAANTTDEFLEELSHQYHFAEINLNRFNQAGHPKFRVSMKRNYELELLRSWEELRKGYQSNTIRNIRKAEQSQISIMENADPISIIEMFRNEKGREIKKMGSRQYQMLEKLIYRSIYKNAAQVLGAYDVHNRLCAGVFLLVSHQRIIMIFSANNKIARQTGAMHMLMDRIIQKNAGQALTLDFEGSEIPGLARFYASFGSVETFYPALYYNKLPLHIRFALKAMKLLGLKS